YICLPKKMTETDILIPDFHTGIRGAQETPPYGESEEHFHDFQKIRPAGMAARLFGQLRQAV
ncbi:hypothetical protein AAAV73_12960, partial [Hominicoprocola fusiformis]|nr:hypothetical protein [Hominicoprocola fusiformis]